MCPAHALDAGQTLGGKYVIEEPLGEGAMGVVYAARHRLLNKRVAVKTLRGEIADDEALIGRFEQEARAASAIGHPHIVEVFDLGQLDDGTRFMVMEYLTGESLGSLLEREERLEPPRAGEILMQVLSALSAAHRQGIVHRDLKPENIFITATEDRPEFVKLLDFGISKVLSGADPSIAGDQAAARATHTGSLLGTPLYMSPEQVSGRTDIDHRVDLWAAGCVLYEMLCGCTPFDGDNYQQILVAILNGKYTRPRDLRPDLSAAIESVVVKALAHERSQRFGSARKMREALTAVFTASETVASSQVETAAVPADAAPGATVLGTGVDDDALARGLDRLSQRVAAGQTDLMSRLDAIDGPVALADPPATVSEGTPAAAPGSRDPALESPIETSRAQPETRRDIEFRPPADDEAPLELATAPAQSARVAGPARPVPQAAARPSQRAAARRSPPAAAVRTSSRGGGRWWIAAVLVVAGAGAAFLWRSRATPEVAGEGAASARVLIEVTPADSEVWLGSQRVQERTLEGVPGKPLSLTFRAADRLSLRRWVVPELAAPMTVQVSLPPEAVPWFGDSCPSSVGPSSGPEGAAPDAVEQALHKQHLYAQCLAALEGPLAQTAKVYRATTLKKKLKRDTLPDVLVLPDEVVQSCRLWLGSGLESGAALVELDRLATEYRRELDELVRMLRRLSTYYTDSEHEQDHFKLGRRMHGPLRQSLKHMSQLHRRLVSQLCVDVLHWEDLQVAAAANEAPQGAHYPLRQALVRGRRWTSLLRAGKAVPTTEHDAFKQAVSEARRFVEVHEQEIGDANSARAYVQALHDLAELGGSKRLQAQELSLARERMARSIELFNRVML